MIAFGLLARLESTKVLAPQPFASMPHHAAFRPVLCALVLATFCATGCATSAAKRGSSDFRKPDDHQRAADILAIAVGVAAAAAGASTVYIPVPAGGK